MASIGDINPAGPDSDFFFVQAADDPETAVARIIDVVKTRIPKRFGLDPIRDIQVLCPMNRGGVGARSLNNELQKVYPDSIASSHITISWLARNPKDAAKIGH
jgi:ATP-dependent exoDNAse (exonuclease V) alpha subunit